MSGFAPQQKQGQFEIARAFHFAASHYLSGMPPGHKCAQSHGHNYTVEVTLRVPEDQLDDTGMVVDYGDLVALERHLESTYDHRCLNAVMECNPTAENLAREIFWWCKRKWAQTTLVRIGETPSTWASYGIVE